MDEKQITKEQIDWVKEHAKEILQSSDGIFSAIPREISGGDRGISMYSHDSWKDMIEKTCETNLDKEKKEQNNVRDITKLEDLKRFYTDEQIKAFIEMPMMDDFSCVGYLCKCDLEVESFDDLKILFDIFIKNGYKITIEKDTTKSFFTIMAEKNEH